MAQSKQRASSRRRRSGRICPWRFGGPPQHVGIVLESAQGPVVARPEHATDIHGGVVMIDRNALGPTGARDGGFRLATDRATLVEGVEEGLGLSGSRP
jgi:hypothetical protein